jgi:hypothetical protein
MRPAGWWWVLLALPLLGASPARFREHVLATDLKGGYQVVPLDVNRDGQADLVALASGMSELVWFEGPRWERRVLASGMSRMINLTSCSSDAGGYPEIVVAHAFENEAKGSLGTVSVLRRAGDPLQPWTVSEIDRLPTSHRLRCADFDGSGKPAVVNAPLTGIRAEKPDFRDQVPLVYYRPGEWKRHLIGEENEGVMHGIDVYDWDGDGRDDILTASFSGIHAYCFGRSRRWRRLEIAKGDPSPWPRSGASDVTVGRLGKRRFLASIEPWHGNQVAVYRQNRGGWVRQVIDDTLVDGHTIAAADLNNDGLDEIVAGYRGAGRSVHIYYAADREGRSWSRTVLDDGGIAAASCAVVDLNADNRPDLACIGSATANLKWYENLGNVTPGSP